MIYENKQTKQKQKQNIFYYVLAFRLTKLNSNNFMCTRRVSRLLIIIFFFKKKKVYFFSFFLDEKRIVN